MSCKPCGTQSAISDLSSPLINNFKNGPYAPALTGLLRALDKVEIRMRKEAIKVDWKPSQFPQDLVPYGQKPQGTEVVFKNTPLYFEDNAPYEYDLHTPGPEGGICAGDSLCGEPPANQVPGDTYQTFTYRMKGTAFETPTFCLKDLLFYENGPEYLRRFLTSVESTPFTYYDNYIRNNIWESGEKYLLSATDVGLLWNSPDRVSARVAPNINDFRSFSPASSSAEVATPKLAAIQHLKYILDDFMGDDCTPFNIDNQPTLMMVGTEPDLYSFAYNDSDVTPANWAQGGMGFNLFDFKLVNKLPFAFKDDKKWFRGDFDSNGEFKRIPAKVYVPQNGGQDLRTNPLWLTAKYGVLTFMTSRPFIYKRFAALPSFDSKVPKETLQYLSPRFQFVPLMEKCNYNRGLVAWRAEDEFGFAPTGERIIHVIYRRDELGAYLRSAKVGECITVVNGCNVEIPTTCSKPEPLGCCAIAGQVISGTDYRDTTYSIDYSAGIVDYLNWNLAALPFAAQFRTVKGTFDGLVTGVNKAGTKITFAVDPAQHTGGHFCCTDQLLGFTNCALEPKCSVLVEGGLRPDPFSLTQFHALMTSALKAEASDVVKLFLNTGCGRVGVVEATITSINNDTRKAVLTVNPANFPNGLAICDVKQICAANTEGCEECLPDVSTGCVADEVTPFEPCIVAPNLDPFKGFNAALNIPT